MHLYVHVPFCARRCSYCDFAIAVRRHTPDQRFVTAVTREWRLRRSAGEVPQGQIATLYFGGGTPSRLDPDALGGLIATLVADAPLRSDAEVTLEVNPDDVTPSRAEAWRRAGVNRVSLGVQSHDPAVLHWMHRTHRAEQVAPAVEVLRAAGLANLSIDLIFALPAALQRDWHRDVALTLALRPDHLSAYGLTIESGTPLFRWTARGESVPLGEERYAAEYLELHRAVGAAGMTAYEVSNFSRPAFVSRHNSAYWTGADYTGLGPSAHSHAAGVRSWNTAQWSEYERIISRGELPRAGREELDAAARSLEGRYLALRTRRGLGRDEVPAATRDLWQDEGWAVEESGRIRLTPEGWLRLDALVAALDHS